MAPTRVRLRIVNGHYQSSCNQRLHLKKLSVLLKNATLYLARPTMLTCRLMGKRVQFFPNGTVQVLAGGVTQTLLRRIHHLVLLLLTSYAPNSGLRLGPWSVTNLVIQFYVENTCFNFQNIMCNGRVSYEPELFPALLMTEAKSAHVTLFPNGKGVITGIRRYSDALTLINSTVAHLKQCIRNL